MINYSISVIMPIVLLIQAVVMWRRHHNPWSLFTAGLMTAWVMDRLIDVLFKLFLDPRGFQYPSRETSLWWTVGGLATGVGIAMLIHYYTRKRSLQ
jgi:hypothetical protein